MVRKLVVLVVALAVIGLGVFWVVTTPTKVSASSLPAYTPDVVNGQTIFNVGGCTSCHAVPGQADRTLLGGGLAITSPFGTFYAPNISQNPEDGIGRWSEVDFINAMMKGTSPDGSHYFPAFPYSSYQHMKPEDVRDLFAFLRTLPQASGRVRDHDLPFPFNVRRNVGVWKWLFLDGKPFVPDATKTEQWNRGAYLVNGPGHCAECHSPRNLLGGIVTSQRLAGGPNPEGEGWVPNITQNGLSDWSEDDFRTFLASGETPEGDVAGGSMAAVIRNISRLDPDDRAAMAAYLKSLPSIEGPKPPPRR